jgi:hypothetical protein
MPSDEEAIVRCALDYFEGWFDANAERMRRAVHSDLAKRSLDIDELDHLTAEQMIEATAAGSGKKRDPGERRIDVRVVDVHGDIASVVADTNVYYEYLHLVRTPDGWEIANVLWEPAQPDERE